MIHVTPSLLCQRSDGFVTQVRLSLQGQKSLLIIHHYFYINDESLGLLACERERSRQSPQSLNSPALQFFQMSFSSFFWFHGLQLQL